MTAKSMRKLPVLGIEHIFANSLTEATASDREKMYGQSGNLL